MPFFLKKHKKTFIFIFFSYFKFYQKSLIWLWAQVAMFGRRAWLECLWRRNVWVWGGGCLRFVEKCVSLLVKFMIC